MYNILQTLYNDTAKKKSFAKMFRNNMHIDGCYRHYYLKYNDVLEIWFQENRLKVTLEYKTNKLCIIIPLPSYGTPLNMMDDIFKIVYYLRTMHHRIVCEQTDNKEFNTFTRYSFEYELHKTFNKDDFDIFIDINNHFMIAHEKHIKTHLFEMCILKLINPKDN